MIKMRYGILPDIHGNWEALSSVLEELEKEKVNRFLIPGDVVGYGAEPRKCLDKVEELDSLLILGNHDCAVLGLENLDYFNHHARIALEWTQSNLNSEHIKFLRSLSIKKIERDFLLVHATPGNPEEWKYLVREDEAWREFNHFNERICFLGHTHIPLVVKKNCREVKVSSEMKFILETGCRYLVNVGSVGQPRDGIPDAACGIYDSDEESIMIKRVPYDIETAARKIVRAGLPRSLSERLYLGM